MFNNISYILYKPQLSENIGACARAMKNFDFSKLIVINPKPIFPNCYFSRCSGNYKKKQGL